MLAKVLVAKMPVNASVHQPMGLLHGGASALAESGKCGLSFLLIKEQEVRGIEISANHLVFRRSRYGYCTNYSQRKNASSGK
jgi:uncharacterized protein (TIGR00369 family)